jgi:proteasome assembly chaperone (PAC2) family protein
VRYLVRQLPAKHFAAIDPEEFFDFTQVRPYSIRLPSGERSIRWPRNEFYYFQGDAGGRDVVLFLGTEPSLKWTTFCNTIVELAGLCNVTTIVTLGALLDAVPHTREPRISGSAGDTALQERLDAMAVRGSGYQGPTGIHSVLYDVCRREGYAWASLWGHAPHYIQGARNPKIAYAILERLTGLLGLEVDLEELRVARDRFEHEVAQVLDQRPELASYVQQLEQRYEERYNRPPALSASEIPDPEDLVRDLEDFLRQQRKGSGETPPD